MNFIDTHCHIHDSEFAVKFTDTQDSILRDARAEGVIGFVCVGTDITSSNEAVEFSGLHPDCYATVAIHPHEAQLMPNAKILQAIADLDAILQKDADSIIAIGECGLDYYYHEGSDVRERQKQLLKGHIELAVKYQLPLIFHIRSSRDCPESELGDAFKDFFEIFDDYKNLRGVVHSFSANMLALEGAVSRGLYIGLNGIMTFTKQTSQIEAAQTVPIEKLVLETDAPFLTPAPFRGKMCEPKHVIVTATFLSELRGETLDQIAIETTKNAKRLFGI